MSTYRAREAGYTPRQVTAFFAALQALEKRHDAALQQQRAAPVEQSSLIAFTQATKPSYRPADLHRAIAAKLEAVERGEIRRLLVEVPPRNGKSELVSVRFPPWYLGKHPARRVIAVSYADALARSFGRKARNVLQSDAYRAIFPGVTTARDSSSVNDWSLQGTDGGYIAAGIGGPITGHGAHVVLIDDPVKNREQADSPLYRELVWEWYNDVLLTRLEEDGAIVLCMTRWHKDDLAGRLLDTEPDKWDVLCLPAIAEEDDPLGRPVGAPLWPEKYPLSVLLELQATDLDFDALYQQHPTTRQGVVFDRAWTAEHRYDAGDAGLGRMCVGRWLSWDTALKDKQESDYSACSVFELLPDYRLVLREVYRDKLQFPLLPSTIAAVAQRHNADLKLRGVLIEDKASGTSAYQTLMQTAPDWLRPLLVAYPPHGSKLYRAQQAAVWLRNGMVLFPRPSEHVPWLADFEKEFFDFPQSPHDDMVDGFSQGVLYLENLIAEGYRARNGHAVAA
jgi:predicted phage terminase large subunit-like protein